uniref:Uncharacterized protein n=1 Tax=Anguilla anguilla TaxID=7936 RepID=A0A0E9XNJ1_ANGAN
MLVRCLYIGPTSHPASKYILYATVVYFC